MTIAQRIADADFLWQSGRREGALLSALVAFATTARRVHPKSEVPSDAKAFKQLFREQRLHSRVSVQFRESLTSMDDLFYKWLRCELIHEGGLPVGLTLDADDDHGLFTVTLTQDLPVAVSAVWYHSLVLAVMGHPVNSDIFPNQEEMQISTLEKHRNSGQRIIGMITARLPSPPEQEIPPLPVTGGINLSKEG